MDALQSDKILVILLGILATCWGGQNSGYHYNQQYPGALGVGEIKKALLIHHSSEVGSSLGGSSHGLGGYQGGNGYAGGQQINGGHGVDQSQGYFQQNSGFGGHASNENRGNSNGYQYFTSSVGIGAPSQTFSNGYQNQAEVQPKVEEYSKENQENYQLPVPLEVQNARQQIGNHGGGSSNGYQFSNSQKGGNENTKAVGGTEGGQAISSGYNLENSGNSIASVGNHHSNGGGSVSGPTQSTLEEATYELHTKLINEAKALQNHGQPGPGIQGPGHQGAGQNGQGPSHQGAGIQSSSNQAPSHQGSQGSGYQDFGRQVPVYEGSNQQGPSHQSSGFQDYAQQAPALQGLGQHGPAFQAPVYQDLGFQGPNHQSAGPQEPDFQNGNHQGPPSFQGPSISDIASGHQDLAPQGSSYLDHGSQSTGFSDTNLVGPAFSGPGDSINSIQSNQPISNSYKYVQLDQNPKGNTQLQNPGRITIGEAEELAISQYINSKQPTGPAYQYQSNQPASLTHAPSPINIGYQYQGPQFQPDLQFVSIGGRPDSAKSVFKGQPYLPLPQGGKNDNFQRQNQEAAYRYDKSDLSARPEATFKGNPYLPLPPASGGWR